MVGTKAYMGSSTSTCLFNLYNKVIWAGAAQGTPLFTVKGMQLWEGASTSRMVLNWTGQQLSLIDVYASIVLFVAKY